MAWSAFELDEGGTEGAAPNENEIAGAADVVRGGGTGAGNVKGCELAVLSVKHESIDETDRDSCKGAAVRR